MKYKKNNLNDYFWAVIAIIFICFFIYNFFGLFNVKLPNEIDIERFGSEYNLTNDKR